MDTSERIRPDPGPALLELYDDALPQVYGCLLALTGGPAEPVVVPTFTVPDLAAADDAVRAAGGRTGDPSSGHDGRTADATDDQGAPFRLRQR